MANILRMGVLKIMFSVSEVGDETNLEIVLFYFVCLCVRAHGLVVRWKFGSNEGAEFSIFSQVDFPELP